MWNDHGYEPTVDLQRPDLPGISFSLVVIVQNSGVVGPIKSLVIIFEFVHRDGAVNIGLCGDLRRPLGLVRRPGERNEYAAIYGQVSNG